MTNILLIGLGGSIGAIFRFWLSNLFKIDEKPFHYLLGTASVNLIGCFLFGLAVGLIESKGMISRELRSFLLVGLLGGFTTFSTFGAETFFLLDKGNFLIAFLNVFGQVLIGVTAVWLGILLSKVF